MNNLRQEALYDALHRNHFDSLVKFCRNYVNNDPELKHYAEDWVQEAFRRALKARKVFAGDNSDYAWLVVTCKHVADNALQRKKTRTERHGAPLDGPLGESIEDVASSLDCWAMKEHSIDQIDRIRAVLTKAELDVFEQHFSERMTTKAIATNSGKPESAVKAAIRRIREKARRIDE